MVSAIRVKVIKPAKVKEATMMRELAYALRETEKGILKDFADTTKTWKHEVEFEHEHTLTPAGGHAIVQTGDEIYAYVNNGTKEHPITPHGPWKLRFRWGGKGSYRAKTKPRRFGSTPGGPSGPEVHMASVQHPGTDPRDFDKLFKERWATLFPRVVNTSMEDAAKASGHGMP